ncbi:leucine-rich repeat protein [Flavobacteriaceae bacterium]|nr:leucine-rich repeat protein [Flavobacteriaceae bacterium]
MITHLQNSVLTLLFLLSIGSINAQTPFIVDGLSYTVTEDTNVSVGKDENNLPTGSLTIPATVTNSGIEYTVNAIKDSGFDTCTGLTSVSVPETVTSIGNEAFYDCTNLMSISIPETVMSIGEGAFSYCTGLTSIDIPKYLTSIEYDVFNNCTSLTSIDIPNSVTLIAQTAFYGCSDVTSINIPESVTSIGDGAFGYSKELLTVTVAWTSAIPPISLSVFSGANVGVENIKLIIPNDTFEIYEAAAIWTELSIIETLSTNKNDINTSFSVYPNPASSFLAVTGLKQETAYEVINVLGAKVLEGTLSMTTKIEIETLTKGMYFLKLDSGTLLKFLKK